MKPAGLFFSLLLCCLLSPVAVGQGRPMAKVKGPEQLQPTAVDFGLKGKVDTATAVWHYDGGNDMNMEEEWCFDPAGKLLCYTKRGFGGEHVTRYPIPQESDRLQKTVRDDDGDPTEVRRYTQEGRLLSSAHYVYAEGGALAAVVTYAYGTDDENVVSSHTETYYDKGGRISTVEQYTADAVLQMTEHYRYNRHGDMTKRVQTFAEGTDKEVATEQRKYTYDRQGNWINCIYLHNGKRYCAVSRTIIYHD